MSRFKPNKNMTFAEWYEWWYASYMSAGRRDVTLAKYQAGLKRFKKYGLGQFKLTAIDRGNIQEYVNELGRVYRKQTMLDHLQTVRSSLTDAVQDGWIKVNPALRIDLVSMEDFMSVDELKKIRNEKKSLELDEYYRLVSFLEYLFKQMIAKGDSAPKQRVVMTVGIYFLAKTGARFAEMLGVSLSDVDLTKREIRIEKTFNYKKSSGGFEKTKNLASIRTIGIDNEFASLLSEYLNWVEQYDVDIDPSAIFVIRKGRPFNSTYNKFLEEILKTIGIERLTLHKLRHTHASILIAEKVPLQVIAKRLGHTDTNMIQRTYGHLLESTKEEGNKLVLEILGGEKC